MTEQFSIIKLTQGSDNWLAWRRNGIGASDAPAIMGENPWKTPDEIMKDKLGLSKPSYNAAMERGSALEPKARQLYVKEHGVPVKPMCLQSTAYEWLRASVDGLSHADERVVEIKCGVSVYRHTAIKKSIPLYYYGQLQHILAVTGYDGIDFWCYLPSRPGIHVRVPRDHAYIDRLIEAEFAFWQRIMAKRADSCRGGEIG